MVYLMLYKVWKNEQGFDNRTYKNLRKEIVHIEFEESSLYSNRAVRKSPFLLVTINGIFYE